MMGLPRPSPESFAVFLANSAVARLPLGLADYGLVLQDWRIKKTLLGNFGVLSYAREVPLTGDTITATQGLGAIHIDPAGAIAALSLVLPPSPVDGQVFEVSTSQDITALTVTAPGGTTVVGVTGNVLAASGGSSWRYDLSRDEWFPRY